jgi:hypothetical protein
MVLPEIVPWHRHHAIHVAGEPPNDTADALIVLRLTIDFD